jgi:hypothetical protein
VSAVGIGIDVPTETLDVIGTSSIYNPEDSTSFKIGVKTFTSFSGFDVTGAVISRPVPNTDRIMISYLGREENRDEYDIRQTIIDTITGDQWTIGVASDGHAYMEAGNLIDGEHNRIAATELDIFIELITEDSEFLIMDADDEPLFVVNDAGNVGIGINIPTETLDVRGTLRIVDGTEAAGYVLTSDANGVASWATGNHNTLDAAYDEGGSGVGRTITADNGAVKIEGADGLLVTGTFGSGAATEISGAGIRMFFNPAKSAFRSGAVGSTEWDDANIGQFSTALGLDVTASGTASIAMNSQTTASGNVSTAMGKVTTAESFAETAIGTYNTDYTPTSTTAWSATDRIFVVGNGQNSGALSNALVMLKNGNTTLNGTLSIVDGTEADGYVLTSDASGNASWATTNHNTLDAAYDEGGSGVGRTITADAGAVQINGALRSDHQGYSLVNDTLDIAALGIKIPWVGVGYELNAGFWAVGSGNLSAIGSRNPSFLVGYQSTTGNSNIKGDTVDITIECPGALIMQTDHENSKWVLGYSAFNEESALVTPYRATMYVLDDELSMDVQVVLMDTSSIHIMSHYGIVDGANSNLNKVGIDSSQVVLTYGAQIGTPTWNPTEHNIILNENGFHTTNTNVGLGTATPSATLDVVGSMQYVDGNEEAGYILNSDASGNATWIDPISIDYSTIPAYANRATAEAALAVGRLFRDESADKVVKVAE